MTDNAEASREGSLEAPIRHPIPWREAEYYDEASLLEEMERVFDICHGCRRCVNLCHAFPTLFDLIDESPTLEVGGVAHEDYRKVSEQCYLCDMCYMSKCPYVPPHEWNVDFPHLMLRAKAVQHRKTRPRLRDRLLASTDRLGRLARLPGAAAAMNFANARAWVRVLLEKCLGIHRRAWLPRFHGRPLKRRLRRLIHAGRKATADRPRLLLFATCYGNGNEPDVAADLVSVLERNDVQVRLLPAERCCGMPKLELGDLKAVQRLKEFNVRRLAPWVEEGWTPSAPIPSCVLMFRRELPLLFPDDERVGKVARAFRDPYEYLADLHRAGRLDTGFERPLGKLLYHAPCHQRVQNLGQKTREVLELVPGTEVTVIERCSGHDGSYALKRETHDIARKICRPVVDKIERSEASCYFSDCPLAARHIQQGLDDHREPTNGFALLKRAYGIE